MNGERKKKQILNRAVRKLKSYPYGAGEVGDTIKPKTQQPEGDA